MREYTKSNPGCYHSMLNYLSQITGISRTKEVEIPNIAAVKKFNYSTHFILNGSELGSLQPITKKGGVKVLTTKPMSTLELPIDQVFDRIYIIEDRKPPEFGITPNKAGNYKDSLGGGWYSTVSLLEINGHYFAMMECSC